MRPHTLVFAASGNTTDVATRWQEALAARWPGDAPPVLDRRTVDGLQDVLELHGIRDTTPLPSAAIVVFGPSVQPSQVDRLVEALLARNIPALCLMKNPAEWRPFQRHGVMFESWDADPGIAAGMLFALAERQSIVEVLSREVALAQRCQGGIRLEMDRIHEELHLAAAIQREFTSSPLPRISGLDLGVLFRPVNFVSGDIYNVQALPDGKAAFFVADAVGHGVPAALLTMVLTNSITTTERVSTDDPRVLEPSEVLVRLNNRLCQSCLGSSRFATGLYGVIDPATRRVSIAGAGHPFPLVLSRAGAREVETDGPLLGVFPEATFSQVEFELAPDETLLLYTDGLDAAFPRRKTTPAHAPREYVTHLARVVGGHDEHSLEHVLLELGSLLDEQSGSLHQADDVTALGIAPARHALRENASPSLAA
jgi:sigma-B regulation protein RsbU (phosphoserine phosphatase)